MTEPVNDEAPSHPNETENPESQENHEINIEPGTPTRPMHGRQPSLSLQSKIRSSSFRKASGSISLSPTANGGKSVPLPPLSPDGDAVTEIYRKQAGRIEDLERENKRLAKDAEVAENRWRKTEEELEELRENTLSVEELKARAKQVDSKTEEINKLV